MENSYPRTDENAYRKTTDLTVDQAELQKMAMIDEMRASNDSILKSNLEAKDLSPGSSYGQVELLEKAMQDELWAENERDLKLAEEDAIRRKQFLAEERLLRDSEPTTPPGGSYDIGRPYTGEPDLPLENVYPELYLLSGITGKWIKIGIQLGKEQNFGNDFRIAPFGNRTGKTYGEPPHYHRRGPIDPKTGGSIEGQGIGRHRPWQTMKKDTSFWDRF